MGIVTFMLCMIGFIAAAVEQTDEIPLSNAVIGYMFLALLMSIVSIIMCQVSEEDEVVVMQSASDVEESKNDQESELGPVGATPDVAALEAVDVVAEEAKDFEETGAVGAEPAE